jgi:hypothetical protein
MAVRHLIPLTVLTMTAAPAVAAEIVPVSHFASIELNGGGTVAIRQGPMQRVTITDGSTEFTRIRVSGRENRNNSDRLVIDACNDRCPRHYRLRIEIETPDLAAVAVNGGGAIVVQPGFAPQRDVAASVNGGGQIDLRALPVRAVAAAVSGGGNLLLRAQYSLAASVSGGGAIRYWGNPRTTVSIEGGGTVTRGQ